MARRDADWRKDTGTIQDAQRIAGSRYTNDTWGAAEEILDLTHDPKLIQRYAAQIASEVIGEGEEAWCVALDVLYETTYPYVGGVSGKSLDTVVRRAAREAFKADVLWYVQQRGKARGLTFDFGLPEARGCQIGGSRPRGEYREG